MYVAPDTRKKATIYLSPGKMLSQIPEATTTKKMPDARRVSVYFYQGYEKKGMTGETGLEPAASGVTGRRYNQLNYAPA